MVLAQHLQNRSSRPRRHRCSSLRISTGWTTLPRRNSIKPETCSNLLGNRSCSLPTRTTRTSSTSNLASILPRRWATAAFRWRTSTWFPLASTARPLWKSLVCGRVCRTGSRQAEERACSAPARVAGGGTLWASSIRPTLQRTSNVKIDRHLPRGRAPADHVPHSAYGKCDQSRCRQLSRLHKVGEGKTALRSPRLQGARLRKVLMASFRAQGQG